MKSLKHYLMESARTYNYTIKFACDLPKDFMEMFKYNLNKFAPTEIGEPTTTPIQKDPYGFPHLKNVPVTMLKCKFRYPTTEPMIHQVVQLLGHKIDVNCVRVIQTDYNDSVADEARQYENEAADEPLLTKPHPNSSAAEKSASEAYGNQYLDSIKKQGERDRVVQPFAGTKTPIATDAYTRQKLDKRSTTSPMTNISRPPRPKTGSSR